ncbi:MAG: hypothetical protein ACLQDV_09725 [Candidatus Binataceae bacterium]
MKTVIRGVLCDPDTATLIAKESNGATIENLAQLNAVELYRTVSGRFFVQRTMGPQFSTELLSRTDAMALYGSMTDRRLDLDEAFAD